ncbi:uncharacterized protein LOC144172998 [Haemaphysalis longicornis]
MPARRASNIHVPGGETASGDKSVHDATAGHAKPVNYQVGVPIPGAGATNTAPRLISWEDIKAEFAKLAESRDEAEDGFAELDKMLENLKKKYFKKPQGYQEAARDVRGMDP